MVLETNLCMMLLNDFVRKPPGPAMASPSGRALGEEAFGRRADNEALDQGGTAPPATTNTYNAKISCAPKGPHCIHTSCGSSFCP